MRATIALALTLFASPAAAEQAGFVAMDLGNMLGSEQYCGLNFDREAISAYVTAQVPADDMSFAGNVKVYADSARADNEKLSPSEKAAFCTQTERAARAHGFIK